MSSAPLRVVYTDLDGTLLGRGGSLFAGSEGVTMRAVEAIAALHREGIAIVPLSGRTEAQVYESARLLGATDYAAEIGGIVVRGGERSVNRGAFTGAGSPYDAMARQGAAGLLLERFEGRLEPHAPWAFLGRECTMLLRGQVDPQEVTAMLEEAGFDWLHLVDNGRITHPGPTDPVNAYHLAPKGVDKAAFVALDLEAREISGEAAVVVGDAPSEAAAAAHVRTVFIVANGAETLGDRERPANLRITSAARGEGFAEAVSELLGAG